MNYKKFKNMLTFITITNNYKGDNGRPSLTLGNLLFLFHICNMHLDLKTNEEIETRYFKKNITFFLVGGEILVGTVNSGRIYFSEKFNPHLKNKRYLPGDLIHVVKVKIEGMEQELMFDNIDYKREQPESILQKRRFSYLSNIYPIENIGQYVSTKNRKKEVDIIIRHDNIIEIEELKANSSVTDSYLEKAINQIWSYKTYCDGINKANLEIKLTLVFSGKFSNISDDLKRKIKLLDIKIVQEVEENKFVEISL